MIEVLDITGSTSGPSGLRGRCDKLFCQEEYLVAEFQRANSGFFSGYPFGKFEMSATDVLSGVAVLVAFAALIVSLWQGLLTRRHNRLQVTPYLSCQTHLGGSIGRFGLTVTNSWIGSARIKKVAIFVDDERMEGLDDGWDAAIDKLGIRDMEWAYSPFERGAAVTVGSATWLLSVPASDEGWKQKTRFEQALARLYVVIEYESFYGEAQILDTRQARGSERKVPPG